MNDFEIEIIKSESGYIFNNFETVKKWIKEGVKEYAGKQYSSLEEAKEDKAVLNVIKTRLKTVQKEFRNPYAEVDAQLEELIKIVQKPITAITRLEKEDKNAHKTEQIMAYAEGVAIHLGEHANKILSSKNFFEDRWLKTEYTQAKWKEEVNDKMFNVLNDMASIERVPMENKQSLRAVYYETLSLESVKNYANNSLIDTNGVTVPENEDEPMEYKTIRLHGTNTKIQQVINDLKLIDIDYELLDENKTEE